MSEFDECHCNSCDHEFLACMLTKKLCPRCKSKSWQVTKQDALQVNANVFLQRRRERKGLKV